MTKFHIFALPLALSVSACVASSNNSLDTLLADVNSEISSIGLAAADGEATSEIDISAPMAEALAAATRGYSGYHMALAREREALTQIEAARSAARPQVSSSVSAGGLQETGPRSDRVTGFYGNIRVSQLLSDGGGTQSAVTAAMANALAARAEREGVGNEVAGAAARAWIELWLARQRVDLLDQRVASVTELLTQLERMAQSGMVDAATVDSARRQLVDIELERARLDQGRITTEAQFRQYFRAVPTGAPALQEIIDAETASSLVSSWETAPDVKRAGAELLAARADLARQEAALRPRASIQSGVNSPVKENDPTDITLGLTLEYQISTGGRRRAEIEAARERVGLAENRLRETRDNLVAELDGLAAQLDMMAASIRLAEERSRLAEAEVSAARSQLVTGQSNLRALIDAEIASYRANDQRLSAQAAKLGMQLSIAARTGALTARLGIGQPADAPDAE